MSTRRPTYTVGRLAALTGLTPRVLRHWEALGLLETTRTTSNQRRYDATQLTRLYRVMALRRTGLSLARIGRILDGDDADPTATLREHLRTLEVDLVRRGALRDRLRDALEHPDDPEALTRVITAMTMFEQYVHGYHDEEQARLSDQARALEDLLHHAPGDEPWEPGCRVLEVGCGVGLQTARLLRDHPGVELVAIDVSEESLDRARERVGADAATFLVRDATRLTGSDLPGGAFDHVYCCFVLEHLPDPVAVLRTLRGLLRPGGTVTVVEGDHGSTLLHPDSPAAREVVACQVRLQSEAGGDALIGRRLQPLLVEAGFARPVVSPRQVYVDSTRPELVEGFIRQTFTAMVAGVRDQAVAAGLVTAERFDEGIADLLRTAEPGGTFAYTFFRAVAER